MMKNFASFIRNDPSTCPNFYLSPFYLDFIIIIKNFGLKMVNCGACGRFLAPGNTVVCCACPIKYNMACLAIPEKSSVSKDWICLNCKKSTRRGDNTRTPVNGISESSDPKKPVAEREPVDLARGSPKEDDVQGKAKENAARNNHTSDIKSMLADCMKETREFRSEMAASSSSFTARLDSYE
ncbi:hypothetical protein evm_001207 [Chilo suppressalis]|nr:hypothetical protein evm_001207 [Chilo suppressalis]